MFSLLINGEERICNIFRSSMQVRESPQAGGASMRGQIEVAAEDAAPMVGNLVKLYRDANLEFAGRISDVSLTRDHNAIIYDIDCVDFTADFDTELKSGEVDEGTAGGNIRAIVGMVGKGFTSNNVVTGPDFGVVELDLDTPSQIITRIAQGIEHNWYIDYNRDVHFYYIKDVAAPVETIDFDTNIDDASDLELTIMGSQVKNVVYLTGAKMESENSDVTGFIADGNTRFWPLNYQPVSISDTAVYQDGAQVNLLLDGVDGQAGDNVPGVFLCLENWGIRWGDESPPEEDVQVDISYKYVIEPVIKVEDPDSIAYMRSLENAAGAPSNGRHEMKFEVPDLGLVENEEILVDYGMLILARYSRPPYMGSFNSTTQGWARGQSFRGHSTRWGFDATMYVIGVTKTFYETAGGTRLMYNVQVSTSPFPS